MERDFPWKVRVGWITNFSVINSEPAEFLPWVNTTLAVVPASADDAHRPLEKQHDGVGVRLQLDRRGIEFAVERLADVQRLALQLEVILHKHAVEEDRHIRRSLQISIRVEDGRHPNGVVALPLAGLAGGVDERNALLVFASRLSVGIGSVVIRIENLQLVPGIATVGGSQKDP
jgi:hypothetical protein